MVGRDRATRKHRTRDRWSREFNNIRATKRRRYFKIFNLFYIDKKRINMRRRGNTFASVNKVVLI